MTIFLQPVRNAKLIMSMKLIPMLFGCLHQKENLLFTWQHYFLIREHVRYFTICIKRVHIKKRKTWRVSKFDEKLKKKKDQRSRMHLLEMREYNISRMDSLKTLRKNNTCMRVLSRYIYSSNVSTRWKFHRTVKHLNCNVVTILNTSN